MDPLDFPCHLLIVSEIGFEIKEIEDSKTILSQLSFAEGYCKNH